MAVHRYPIDPAQTTTERARADAAALRTTIRNLRSALDAQGMTSMPIAITEYNITWDGDPAKSYNPASPGTFAAAQWTADVQGVALEEQLWSFDYWSVSEGWTLGMLNGKNPRPAYYALKLYADHFGPTVLSTSGAPDGMSVYASRNAQDDGTGVIVVNWIDNNYDLTVTFQDLQSNVSDVHLAVSAQSISSFEVSDSGQVRGWAYTQANATNGPVSLP